MTTQAINAAQTTILAIDDSPEMLSFFRVVLRRANYRVEVVTDGAKGLELARTLLPDLILCDIMMPGMDGRQLFEELRRDSNTATIPFIFLTALGSTADIFAGLRLGADDYLVKPVTAEMLLHSVEMRLLKYQRVQAAQMQRMIQRLLQTREHERQRVATRLQADIYQNLLGLKMSLGLLEDKENPSLQAEVVSAINETIGQVERLTEELNPTLINHIGLVAGIRWLLEQYEDLNISFDTQDFEYNLDASFKQIIIRILQEALDNVAAHAQTPDVTVAVYYHNATIEITLADQGVGFDLEAVMGSTGMGGLMRMQELATMINALLIFTSNPGVGTTIKLRAVTDARVVTEANNTQHIMRSLVKNPPQVENALTSRTRIPLVVAIEQDFLRQGMIRLLSSIPHLLILAECNHLTALDALLSKHQPSLLIINPISMVNNEFQREIMSQIVQKHKDLHILMVGSNREKAYALNALDNGAHGYVPYNTTLNDLYTAISTTSRGELYVSPGILLEPVPGN